jgi:hypothetical protein
MSLGTSRVPNRSGYRKAHSMGGPWASTRRGVGDLCPPTPQNFLTHPDIPFCLLILPQKLRIWVRVVGADRLFPGLYQFHLPLFWECGLGWMPTWGPSGLCTDPGDCLRGHRASISRRRTWDEGQGPWMQALASSSWCPLQATLSSHWGHLLS